VAAASKPFFRVVHFSVQTDHVHLLVEADGRLALTRGAQGLAIRCARAINRAVHRRGRVWQHRYHAHYLRSPREVRAAYVYVLLNFRKHLRAAPGIDPCSSGRWFDGWARPPPPQHRHESRPVVSARTWLASRGWRRAGGPIDWSESPQNRVATVWPKRWSVGRKSGSQMLVKIPAPPKDPTKDLSRNPSPASPRPDEQAGAMSTPWFAWT